MLPAPVNGSIAIFGTMFESVSVFACDEGFNQSGSSMRECQANGEWSGIDTICTSKESTIVFFQIMISNLCYFSIRLWSIN